MYFRVLYTAYKANKIFLHFIHTARYCSASTLAIVSRAAARSGFPRVKLSSRIRVKQVGGSLGR